MEWPGLEGKRVLVTAGAQGIGRAIAEEFAGAGARVHICDVDAGRMAVSGAEGTVADVADRESVDRLFDRLEAGQGGLDILVNNAGIAGPTAPVDAVDPQDWDRCLAVCLTGAFLCARRAIPLLRAAGGGSIVNISSTAGLFGYPNRAPYAAAKWGVIGLTKTLAMELGPQGIRVNAICPGSVEGPRMDRVIDLQAAAQGLTPEEVRDRYVKDSSLRTFIRAEDIARMTLFLCSDLGSRISGQALAVDGHTEALSG